MVGTVEKKVVVSVVANQQAMAAFKTQFTHLKTQLDVLGTTVKRSFNSFIQPSINAKQAVNGLIQSQRSLATVSKQMKGS